jgi:IS605 OrfB family transposase
LKKQDIRTLTINSKIKSALLNAEELAFLKEYLIHYNHIKFITTSYIKHKNHAGKPISQIKLDCDKNNILPYRLFNASVYKGILGQIQSQLSNKENYLVNTIDDIKSVNKKIEKQHNKVKLIDGMNENLRYTPYNRNDRAKAVKLKTTFNNKLLRLHNKEERLTKEINEGIFKLCYGSTSLLKKRNAIHKNDLPKLTKWKSEWNIKRLGEMLFVGSTDETMGNSNAHIIQKNDENGENNYYLRITVPSSLKYKYSFAHVIIPISISYYKKELQEYIDYHTYHKKSGSWNTINEKGEVVKPTSSLSVRLMKDSKGNFDVGIGISSSLHMKPELKTVEKYGLIGVDINPDHLDIAETDEKGNYLKGWTIPLDLSDKTTKQRKTIISQATKQVIDYALSKGKSIVLEKLDFTKKKQSLKENYNKHYARMLTSFSYGKIKEYFIQQSWKAGVNVIYVNPAYTSFLGNLKYRLKTNNKVNFNDHVSAAFVIARRGQGLKEKIPSKVNLIKYSNINDSEVLTVEQKSLRKMIFDATKSSSFRELRNNYKTVTTQRKTNKDLIRVDSLDLSTPSQISTFLFELLSGFPLYQKLYLSHRYKFI